MTLRAISVSVQLGKRDVLTDISFEVKPGEIIAIAGPNGAGKSTLLRAFAGLVPLKSGQVRLDDQDIKSFDAAALGRSLAYLPQERIVHWPLTAATIAGLGRIPHRGVSRGESDADRTAVTNALAAMDVQDFRNRPISELSGGEKARVLVARALAQDARYLIADEPTAGLDPGHTLTLFEHLTKIASQGRAVVVALHDLSLALRYCHRVALLKTGAMVALGAPGDILSEANLAAVYGVRARLACVDGVPVVVPISAMT